MREQRVMHTTMVSPAPGFTARVMARVQARERARSRRRALVAVGLSIAVALGSIVLVAGALAAWLALLETNPDVASMFAQILDVVSAFAEALWVVVAVAADGIGMIQVGAFALGVLALTLVWARVVDGSSRRHLAQSVWEV